jgi:phenylpyruvate tautomerase PptA (4-oxalocrotonate tautomerase family)
MPTYRVASPTGTLNEEKKEHIAAAITKVHEEVTGAGAHFAQVLFTDVAAGDYFIGGRPVRHGHVFVHGNVRAGRPTELLTQLTERLLHTVSEAAGVEARSVWVYVDQTPHSQIAEWGHVVPAPGQEEAWFAALPEADRAAILAASR